MGLASGDKVLVAHFKFSVVDVAYTELGKR